TAPLAGAFNVVIVSGGRSACAFVFNSGRPVFVTSELMLAPGPLNSGFVFGGFSTTPVLRFPVADGVGFASCSVFALAGFSLLAFFILHCEAVTLLFCIVPDRSGACLAS